jgi:hypothetical protein
VGFADQYDETWMLYDRMLVDDELWALWAELPEGSRIVLFSDSSHSGTVSKAQVPGGAFPWPTEMTNAEGEQVRGGSDILRA